MPDREFIAVDEGGSGLDITAICYDRTRFLANPTFKEFGINIRLTMEETLALEAEIQAWKDKQILKDKYVFSRYENQKNIRSII